MTTDPPKANSLDVLFIDDSKNLCRAMELWLLSSGYSAVTAPNVTEADDAIEVTKDTFGYRDHGLEEIAFGLSV